MAGEQEPQLEGNTPLSDLSGDNWAPGQPLDWADAPSLTYQVLAGQVFTTLRSKDGSVARGTTTLQALADLTGAPISKEGFYNSEGNFLGAQWRDEEAWNQGPEPTLEG